MKRYQRLLLTAISLLAIAAAIGLTAAVLIPASAPDDKAKRPLANLSPEDLDRLVIVVRDASPEYIISDPASDQRPVVTAGDLTNSDGTPRDSPRTLATRRQLEGGTGLSQDAIYLIVAGILASSGTLWLKRGKES